MVTNKTSEIKDRVIDHILSAFVSALVIWFVGWLAGFADVKTRIDVLATAFASHERKNEDYRREEAERKNADDRKWDARINRLENCFIIKNCGK